MTQQSNLEQPNFEQLMQQLEELVASMEAGDLGLEASLQAYEQGVHLTRLCQHQLDQAQQRVLSLQENQGRPEFVPLTFSSTDSASVVANSPSNFSSDAGSN